MSCPAQAGHPVNAESAVFTGSSAFADDDSDDPAGMRLAVVSRYQQQLAQHRAAFQHFMRPYRLGERQAGVDARM
jgi:hypothetical protein